jgi:hypothetical protein
VVVVPTWARVQGLVPSAPVPLLLNVAWPVGKLAVPLLVSATVAVHVVGLFTATEAGVQVTAVDVVRSTGGLTVMAELPAPVLALAAWLLSAP